MTEFAAIEQVRDHERYMWGGGSHPSEMLKGSRVFDANLAALQALAEAAARAIEALETNSEAGAPPYLWDALNAVRAGAREEAR